MLAKLSAPRSIAAARSALGEQTSSDAYAADATLSLNAAVALALEPTEEPIARS